MASLRRRGLRFQPATWKSLDELAETASDVLKRDVPLSAVVRAAVQGWVDAIGSADPALVMAAIQAAMVKRGRKPK
jgi:hypothetical protein